MLISSDGIHQQYFATGGERAEYRAQIRSHPWMPPEKLRSWQLRTLNRAIRLAKRDVPFYADRLPGEPLESLEEFERVRILTRDEVVRAGPYMHSRAHRTGNVVDVRTGGTTGESLVLRVTQHALDRHYGCFMRFREWIGIRDNARVAAFGGRSTIGGAAPHAHAAGNPDALICSADGIDGDSLEGYVSALVDFAPDIIDGFPSTVAPLARFVTARKIRGIHPDAVITSGDVLTPGARRMIEEAFSCPVFDHYGAAEMVALITECRAGSYHVNSDYGYVEIMREGRAALPGETGEIIATGFLNEAMPLIRYATGDMAVAGSTHCPCGRGFPTVERIVGRADESLVAPDGHIVPRLDQVFRSSSSLVEARIVQDAPDHVTVEAVATGQMDPLEIATIMNEIRQRIGPSLRADLVRVPRIPRTTSGRYRAVQRLIFGGTSPHGEARTLERLPA